MEFDFSDPPIVIKKKSGFGYDGAPTMSWDPSLKPKITEAYNRRDWRELNRLCVVWWDEYGERWHKFGPYFWDVNP